MQTNLKKTTRRILVILAALILTASLCSVSATEGDINYTFDESISPWTAFSGTIGYNTDTTKTYGGSAGSLSVTGGQAIVTTELDANATYLVQARVYIPTDLTQSAVIGIRNYKYSSGTPVSGVQSSIDVASLKTTNGGWKYVAIRLKTGADNVWYPYVTSSESEKSVYVDDFSILKADNADNEENLILNGGFENMDISGDSSQTASLWRPDELAVLGTDYAYDTADTHSGTYALKIISTSSDIMHRMSYVVTGLEAGAWYEVSCYAKKVGSAGGYSEFGVFDGTNGKSFSQDLDGTLISASTAGEWTRFSLRFPVPAGKNTVTVQFAGNNKFTDANYVLIDDVQMQEIETGVTITDAVGTNVSEISAPGTYKANFMLLNADTSNTLSRTGIFALYKTSDSGIMLETIILTPIEASAYGLGGGRSFAKTEESELIVSAEGSYKLKAFMWSLDRLESICDAAEVSGTVIAD